MIIRTEKNSHYTTIANFALNDPELSLKAKGLWAFIMSKPDDWDINYRGLSKQLKEGQRAILGALKELEEAGYLERGIVRHENGRYFQTVATLHEQPCVRNVRVDSVRTHNVRTKLNTVELSTDKDIGFKNPMGAKAPVAYGDKSINELLDFWVVTTGIPIQGKAQANRQACYRLLKAKGSEQVKALIKRVAETKGIKGAPIITSPVQLEYKQSDLLVWEKRQSSPAPAVDPLLARRLLHPEKYGKVAA